MQAGEWGEYLERTDFEFENGKATLMDYKLIPILFIQFLTKIPYTKQN